MSKIVNKICNQNNIKKPIVKICEADTVFAKTKFLSFPYFNNIIIVSSKCYNILADNELEALLAHEIGHIKSHTKLQKLLCLLSDFTLMGNGFLNIIQNSFKTENEADDFAITYLGEKKYLLINALLKVEVEAAFLGRIGTDAFCFYNFINEKHREETINNYYEQDSFSQILIGIKLMYQVYFQEEIISYIHPSSEYRVNRIRRILNEEK